MVLTALEHGVTGKRAAEIQRLVGVSRRTLQRWRAWWRGEFVATPFWQYMRARFLPPVAALPGDLVARFAGEGRGRLVVALRFLSPITTASVPWRAGM